MTPTPLSQLLDSARAATGVVAVRGTTNLTWGDFVARSAGLAQVIAANDARYWALYHTDTYTFATALFALIDAGKTVLLPGNVQPGTVQALESEVDAFIGQFPASKKSIVIDPADIELASANVFTRSSATARINLLTSGSGGAPKIIGKTLAQLDAEIAVQEQLWGHRLNNSQIMATVSHQHIYGLIFRLLWPLSSQRIFRAETAAYLETLITDATLQQQCAFVCSPAHLKRLAPTLNLAAIRPRISAVFSSGGPLPAEASSHWRDALGQTPIEIFGSTETGGIAQRMQPDLWRPLPSVQCRIDAENTLAVSSPFIGDENFIATGDQARWVNDGRFELLGRGDDIVKLEEKRISLRELDALLCQHPWIDDARSVLLAGARAQLGTAVVLNSHGAAQLAGKNKYDFDRILRNHLLQFYERVALPRKWRYVERLPENAQGKLRRGELLALFNADKVNAAEVNVAEALPGVVTQEESNQLSVVFDLQQEHAAFAGHFPQLPVLPAVVQLGWVIGYAQKYWYGGAEFSGIDQVKFSELVTPTLELRMHIVNSGVGSVKFTCYVNDSIVSRGRIKFGVANDA